MSDAIYNHLCPVCGGPVSLVGFTIRSCSIPIRPNGWALMATHKTTDGSELFSCATCMVTVPSEWVYRNQSQKEAASLMSGWGAQPFSIHNHKPLPAENARKEKLRKKDDARETEPSSPRSETPGSPTGTDGGPPRPLDTAVRKAI